MSLAEALKAGNIETVRELHKATPITSAQFALAFEIFDSPTKLFTIVGDVAELIGKEELKSFDRKFLFENGFEAPLEGALAFSDCGQISKLLDAFEITRDELCKATYEQDGVLWVTIMHCLRDASASELKDKLDLLATRMAPLTRKAIADRIGSLLSTACQSSELQKASTVIEFLDRHFQLVASDLTDTEQLFLGLARHGYIELTLNLLERFKLPSNTLTSAIYRAFSPMVMAITHGRVDYVRKAAEKFAFKADDVLLPDGDGECDFRAAVKFPAMMQLLVDDLHWLTREHVVRIDLEDNMLLMALSLAEDEQVWRVLFDLGVTVKDIDEAAALDVGSYNINEDAIDACAVVFGSDVASRVLHKGKRVRSENYGATEDDEE